MIWLLSWLCMIPVVSCSFEEEYECEDNGMATLQLGVTAREEGDLNSRASGTEIGQNGEYMHHLCVLLVNSNDVLVEKFLPDLSAIPAAQEGNLKAWNSEPFSLAPGDYTVYAFANIDTYYNGFWGSLTGLQTGADIKPLNIDQIILDDPAGKLDFSNYFIPMSAKKTFTVTPATQSISVGLDRLVSKIRMSITGKPGVKVTALSFGGYADKVSLISGASLSGENYETLKGISLPEDASTIGTDGKLSIADFYVNASPEGHHFQVSASTDEIRGVTYKATTERNELPRNSIFPLTLQLNDYGLDLAARCWVSPIGSLPVEVIVSGFDDTYVVEVPEGCQFEFTINGIKEETGNVTVTGLSSTWDMPEGVSGIAFDGETTGVKVVRGHVTASAGKTFDLILSVTWQDGTASYNRAYTVRVVTKDLTEFPFKPQTRSAEFILDYLKPEILNLFIK